MTCCAAILMSEYLILYLCIALFVLLNIWVPVIRSEYNLSNLLSNIWPLFAVAIGQTFVLIIAGIDLSQGAVISLTSVIGASFIATTVDPVVFDEEPAVGRAALRGRRHSWQARVPASRWPSAAMLMVGLAGRASSTAWPSPSHASRPSWSRS